MATTERLYYDHPSLRTFDAIVLRTEARPGHGAIWLDRTAFYPTSGGQPFDTGTIGGLPVVNVEDDDGGDVVHVVTGPLPEAGSAVQGEIDWMRRFDHMQQHTGQHLLSAVLERAFNARTVSFHLGADSSTIDLDRELTPAELAGGEREANRVVWGDVPVTIRYATEEEARHLPLRKESVRTGTVRLVEIHGVDLSACGGTHVGSSGAIGQVVLASWERFKGGQRLEFLCGGRALARFQQLRDTAAASTRLLSVLPADLPAAIERLQGEAKEQRRAAAALQADLATFEAVALAGTAEVLPVGRVVLQAVDGDAARLKTLASATAATPGTV
ncbi:MAG TPA: alanyl-tRNA editing protein, partial [Vicinamibacterales bacterium]|nr:alanyl-tRNA editing protein [Vicinamibacterales bacterium]